MSIQVRKFRSLACAKDIARMNGQKIETKIWSSSENCYLVVLVPKNTPVLDRMVVSHV